MGYDIGECIICYCLCGCNNIDDDNTDHNICYHCFLKYCPKGLHGRTRLGSYVQVLSNTICDLCDQTSICLYQVSVCRSCLDTINSYNHKLCTHRVDYEICDGSCNCPNCPQSGGFLHKFFCIPGLK